MNDGINEIYKIKSRFGEGKRSFFIPDSITNFCKGISSKLLIGLIKTVIFSAHIDILVLSIAHSMFQASYFEDGK